MPKAAKNRLNFTKTELEKIPLVEQGYVVYHDTVVNGLVLIVYSTSKTFHVYKLVNGRPIKPKVGRFPDVSVEQARKEALRMLGAISQGESVESKNISKASSLKLGELFDRYIDEYAQHHCSTWEETQKNFRRYFGEWLSFPLDTITRLQIQQHMNVLGRERGQHTANRTYDDLRAVYSWGTKYGYYNGENPCKGVTKFKTRSRERFLRPDEFETFLEALKAETNTSFRDYVYLSLFTGARQANVLAMRWDQIDTQLGLWYIPITKNKESQTVPLTDLALQVLADRFDNRKSDEWVFPSNGSTGHLVEPKNAWRKLMDDTKLHDLRMHDLRRTLGSYMAMNNQSLQIIGRVLGHKSPAATQIYSRLAFHPLRQAMEAAQASMAISADILPAGMNKKRKLKRVK